MKYAEARLAVIQKQQRVTEAQLASEQEAKRIVLWRRTDDVELAPIFPGGRRA